MYQHLNAVNGIFAIFAHIHHIPSSLLHFHYKIGSIKAIEVLILIE